MTLKSHNLINKFFAADGPLSALLTAYLPREPQIKMAHLVAKIMSEESSRLVVESGTGTGKSLAYLVAALATNQKVLISTATKTLQDQLYQKDLPLALKIVEKLTGEKKRAVLMKGRSNYLCLWRVENYKPTLSLIDKRQNRIIEEVKDWANVTNTGDRAELYSMSENSAMWTEINAHSDRCLGQKCAKFDRCFVTQMRRSAEGADVIVVNHALLCADRALRINTAKESESDDAFAQILPDADVWVIDEAHALEDVATQHFGVSVTSGQLSHLCRDLFAAQEHLAQSSKSSYIRAVSHLGEQFQEMTTSLQAKGFENRQRIGKIEENPDACTAKAEIDESIREISVSLIGLKKIDPEKNSEIQSLSRRVNEFSKALKFLFENDLSKNGFVTFVEQGPKGSSISAAPVDAAEVMKKALWSGPQSVILTSATLAVDNKLDSFIKRTGLADEDAEQAIFDSPFDYPSQGCLYLPRHISNPLNSGYEKEFSEEVEHLVQMSRGGAFLLFTSYRALSLQYEKLKDRLQKKKLLCLRQGDAPKYELLREFKAGEEKNGAVLFATHSFWEGVDIPGCALRLVVIDRLPFRSPGDPIYQARMDLLQERGLSPFGHLSLPQAALALKQGVGRLIRSTSDVGVVAILDGRIWQKSYGKVLIRSLPPMKQAFNRQELLQFWEQSVGPSGLAPENKIEQTELQF